MPTDSVMYIVSALHIGIGMGVMCPMVFITLRLRRGRVISRVCVVCAYVCL